MKNYNQKIGRWGEEIAAEFLEGKGYLIVDRNFFTPVGEIDLIALWEEDGEEILVFVEVKTRTSDRFGYPEESFTKKKWKHMRGAIDNFLQQQPTYGDNWQVDVIAILRYAKSEPPDIQHFENIVMTDDSE